MKIYRLPKILTTATTKQNKTKQKITHKQETLVEQAREELSRNQEFFLSSVYQPR